jgi:hypothetical protein
MDRETAKKAKTLFALFGQSVNRTQFFGDVTDGLSEKELIDKYRNELGVSQNTPNNLQKKFGHGEKEGEGIVYIEDGEYHLTYFGKQLAEPFSKIVDVAQLQQEVIPILRHFPGWYSYFSDDELSSLADASYTEYSEGNNIGSWAEGEYHDAIRDADELREVLAWNAHLNNERALHRWIVEEGLSAELLINKNEVLDEDPKKDGIDPERASDMIESGSDIRSFDIEFPCNLAITEDLVVFWAWGPTVGYKPAVVVKSESDEIYEWAERQFESIKKESTGWVPNKDK